MVPLARNAWAFECYPLLQAGTEVFATPAGTVWNGVTVEPLAVEIPLLRACGGPSSTPSE